MKKVIAAISVISLVAFLSAFASPDAGAPDGGRSLVDAGPTFHLGPDGGISLEERLYRIRHH